MRVTHGIDVPIKRVEVSVYTVPTDNPESDGTLEWESTTLVLVSAFAGNEAGLGYTYADTSAGLLIQKLLAKIVEGRDAMAVTANWEAMVRRTRNLGRPGIVSMAISAVDVALWDLKARLLGLPLVRLLGPVREAVAIYGSGGFTSYTNQQLEAQLGGWAAAGMPRVKMKIGRDAKADRARVHLARQAIGGNTELFVDANGAYDRKLALHQHLRLNDLRQPEPIPRDTDYASVIDSDIPIVVQHTRLDSRQDANALLSTVAYAGSD